MGMRRPRSSSAPRAALGCGGAACSPACQGLTAHGGASGARSRHGNTGVTTIFSIAFWLQFFQHFYTSSPDLYYLFSSKVTGTNSSSPEQPGIFFFLIQVIFVLSTSNATNTEVQKKDHELQYHQKNNYQMQNNRQRWGRCFLSFLHINIALG